MSNVSVTVDSEDQAACQAVGEMFRRLGGFSEPQTAGCQCDGTTVCKPEQRDESSGVHWPTTLEPSVREVVDPVDGLIDIVTDAGAAFSDAPLVRVNVIPTPPVNACQVELDSRGLPWDRRIHASTKTKCTNGTWKNAKGVDKDLLASVEAELQGAMGTPPVVVPTPPPVVVAPAPPVATLADAAAVSAVLQSPSVPPTAPVPGTYAEMMLYITSNASAKRFTYQDVVKVCQDNGLAGIPLLNARPDMIPAIHAALEALCPTTPA